MRRLLGAFALALLAAGLPAVAAAHPLGNFSINHYAGIRISTDAIMIDLVIDMAEIPSVEAIAALDADGDGTADPAELAAARAEACNGLVRQLTITVGDMAAHPELVAAGMQTAPGAGGLPTLRTVCELRAPIPEPITAPTDFGFEDGSYPERIGWREIVVRGDGVTISSADAGRDLSDRLSAYPTDLLQQPLNERNVTLTLTPGGAALERWSAPDAWRLDARPAPSSGSVTAVPGGVGSELVSLIDFRELSLPLMLVGLLVAAVAGAGHALSPGHGKTVMAAYLIGSRGGARHAVLLGTAVTASHTLGVLLLAAIVLLAGSVVPPERLYPILTVASGATVIVIGAVLLVGCIKRALARDAHDHDHRVDHGEGTHRHGWRVHSHRHESEPRALPGWRGLAALGIAGGLVPSTSALILLLGAIGAGQAAYGVALALAFGIGMAAVLTGIGLALVQGRTWLGRIGPRWPAARFAAAALPWVTAVVVIAGGLVLTGQTLVTTL
jgi:nickel/cobalt exporter